ncbi:NADH-quinone oxidoreductase subunit J [Halorussus salilacus]|uniref:NADH-quinone oxidoreductase subunit J n=1 Tax=Halorussus salilacus TaxID=2953750 RepID=UPI00209E1D44|nr:NADH-quinone oxidoreductase subunit J [Halorussus salilacus]USZ68758.1 NADH-quinone oxidoreductase subunit J [Halorussus salilacus]
MTNRDRGSLLPGLAAVALFAVLAVVFVRASFGDPAAEFAGDAGVTASIGYAMFNIQHPDAIPSEGFLVAFLVIAVVLDAALDGAVLLARRDEDGVITTALRSDAADEDATEERVATDGGTPAGTDRDAEEVND